MPNDEFGDFQTPAELAALALNSLKMPKAARILEPTCGTGSFLHAASEIAPDSERVGIEINPEYAAVASRYGRVAVGNFFQMRLSDIASWQSEGPLFVVGNPPWVTSSELTRMDSSNLPKKENFKGARGLDAILGSSNFDVCEYSLLKLLEEFRRETFTLGMLCKTQVARNVIEYAAGAGYPLISSELYRINAMEWFNAGVDACWFVARSDPKGPSNYSADVFPVLTDPRTPIAKFGVIAGRMVSDVKRYELLREADGHCPFEWRSGLKHDAAAVFELSAAESGPMTKDGQTLDLETDYLFPFLKSTDVFRGRELSLERWVIVPQRSFGEETNHLKITAPKLWAYLESNSEALDGRKSSIYRNRPRFSVFGHGQYTFAPYKVAVSGLHKETVFRLVPPIEGKPVVLDDTCYFLPFDDGMEAAVTWAILSSQQCRNLIESLVFWDSKRPLTKKLLARIDLNKLPIDRESILDAARAEAKRCGIATATLPASSRLTLLGGEADTTLF